MRPNYIQISMQQRQKISLYESRHAFYEQECVCKPANLLMLVLSYQERETVVLKCG